MVIRKENIKVQKRIKGTGRMEREGSGKAAKRIEKRKRFTAASRRVTISPTVSNIMTLPAHNTKHIPSLDYHFLSHSFLLLQHQDGTSTGTALWLGAQCLSAYLATIHIHSRHTRPRVLELGSGIGLAAFVLSFSRFVTFSDMI
jgi:hypothetical protein